MGECLNYACSKLSSRRLVIFGPYNIHPDNTRDVHRTFPITARVPETIEYISKLHFPLGPSLC